MLAELGEETSIDLRKSIRDYVTRIAALHEELWALLDPTMREALAVFRAAQTTYSKIEGEMAINPSLSRIEDSNPARPMEEMALVSQLPTHYAVCRGRPVAQLIEMAARAGIEPATK
jgi:hypothetical protein